VTGLGAIHPVAGIEWDDDRCDALGIPTPLLPRIVDSSEQIGPLTRLPGSPMLCALIGDQQASLVGQGCVSPGVAKMTFGTGAMLDMAVGSSPPLAAKRHAGGTIPIVTWRIDGKATWGVEAIMLSAGTCVEWLRDDMGLIGSAAESEAVAAAVPDTGDVWFVPALLGLATPHWDYGARGTLVGLTRGTERAHVVRAVLEGVAQRGADLVLAAVADSALPITTIRVDGGMSRNKVFAQALADATALPVEISPQTEATALGAGFLAGLPTGSWPNLASIGKTWSPITVYTPQFAQGSERMQYADRKDGSLI
jgi:glycerol kinase